MPRRFRQDHKALHLHRIRLTGQGHLLRRIRDQMLRRKKSIDLPRSRFLSNGEKMMITGDSQLPLRTQDQAAGHYGTDVKVRVEGAGKSAGNTEIRG